MGVCGKKTCSHLLDSSSSALSSGHGFVLGLSGRGLSLTISPVSRSVQVLPAAFDTEPAWQGLALTDSGTEADGAGEAEGVASGPEVTRPSDMGVTTILRDDSPSTPPVRLTLLVPPTPLPSRFMGLQLQQSARRLSGYSSLLSLLRGTM